MSQAPPESSLPPGQLGSHTLETVGSPISVPSISKRNALVVIVSMVILGVVLSVVLHSSVARDGWGMQQQQLSPAFFMRQRLALAG
jgi:hypothetical protein